MIELPLTHVNLKDFSSRNEYFHLGRLSRRFHSNKAQFAISIKSILPANKTFRSVKKNSFVFRSSHKVAWCSKIVIFCQLKFEDKYNPFPFRRTVAVNMFHNLTISKLNAESLYRHVQLLTLKKRRVFFSRVLYFSRKKLQYVRLFAECILYSE